jgi:hypothetical protein
VAAFFLSQAHCKITAGERTSTRRDDFNCDLIFFSGVASAGSEGGIANGEYTFRYYFSIRGEHTPGC